MSAIATSRARTTPGWYAASRDDLMRPNGAVMLTQIRSLFLIRSTARWRKALSRTVKVPEMTGREIIKMLDRDRLTVRASRTRTGIAAADSRELVTLTLDALRSSVS
jgi:hypothetical protein